MVKNRLDRAIQSERNLKEQIDVLKGVCCSLVFCLKSKIELPDDIPLSISYRDKIADLRFRTV